jgi:crotonobetainyl-CoA:carnitine CoA-transferase CaiB-like acyl-CoA transferase
MQTVCATFLADSLMQFAVTGEVPPRIGNHHPDIAPHNIYPCAGEDRWIAIAAETEEQFERLATVAGHTEWLTSGQFRTNSLRKQNEAELDRLIGEWTAEADSLETEQELLALGVPATTVLHAADVILNEQSWHRGTLARVEHPDAGEFAAATTPVHVPGVPPAVVNPAPTLGQHSREVFGHILGMSDEDYS